ncbi:hypothetical protein AB6A40_004799 [Gnathostoma spinigerum]|uniref:Uncharacterized protein n=1 Tax=Gnathostoma spinigerum TaxID=75299 RepID=A0ABD6EPB0_9BILA
MSYKMSRKKRNMNLSVILSFLLTMITHQDPSRFKPSRLVHAALFCEIVERTNDLKADFSDENVIKKGYGIRD